MKLLNIHWFLFEFIEKQIVPDLYCITDYSHDTSKQDKYLKELRTFDQEKVQLIRHFPPHLSQYIIPSKYLSRYVCKLTSGYRVNLKDYTSIDNYLKVQRGAKSRSKLRRYIRRLEKCFNVRYEIFLGSINRKEYETLMDRMYDLISIRFAEKEEVHGQLNQWGYYKSICYDLIKNQQASLFVIYNDQDPISINLNFHFQNIVFNTVRAFNVDYSQFCIGQIDLYKQLDWCLKNNYEIFDLGYGDLDYKQRWCNEIYEYENHIFFRKNNPLHLFIAILIRFGFILKKRFDSLNISKNVSLLSPSSFYKPNQHSDTRDSNKGPVKIHVLKQLPDKRGLTPVTNPEIITNNLKKTIYDFQYRNSVNTKELRFFKVQKEDVIIVQGNNKTAMIEY